GRWLGVGDDAPVWCTAAVGSPESIWLLLAGWHEGANIVNVDLELDPEDLLELLGRLGAAAVWFSDEEYERLASAVPAAWIDGSVNRALLSDERSSGATAFANAVGANVAAVFGLAELGVVAGWPAGTEGEDTTVARGRFRASSWRSSASRARDCPRAWWAMWSFEVRRLRSSSATRAPEMGFRK